MQTQVPPRSSLGWVFVLAAVCFMLYNYYDFLHYFLPLLPSVSYTPYFALTTVTVSFLLLTWTFLAVVRSDPGRVPRFWGFSMHDVTVTRRRYCLMCHVFKPERAHHCSVCNRCVLHMDHHCPWVNNCIGFFNRKLFLLLLMYSLTSLYAILAFKLRFLAEVFTEFRVKSGWTVPEIVKSADLLGFFTLQLALALTLTLFFKHHLHMALTGTTTIEEMEPPHSKYNYGYQANWQGICGSRVLCWGLPIVGDLEGDGIQWGKKTSTQPDTPRNGSKTVDLTAQQSALFQLRNVARKPAEPAKMDTAPHDESEMKGLNVQSGNSSSFLSQSFKF